jgi:hypothetical protein
MSPLWSTEVVSPYQGRESELSQVLKLWSEGSSMIINVNMWFHVGSEKRIEIDYIFLAETDQ